MKTMRLKKGQLKQNKKNIFLKQKKGKDEKKQNRTEKDKKRQKLSEMDEKWHISS